LDGTIPVALDPIEKAFFGAKPLKQVDQYEKERKEFRDGHSRARKPKPRKLPATDSQASSSNFRSAAQETADKLVLDDPRPAGRHRPVTTALPADSLVAKVQRDDFNERDADLAFLSRFLASRTCDGLMKQFRWALVTGPAGAGKTRLAIQFLDTAEKQDFRVGFLELDILRNFDARGWRPTRPTFMVIDYPAQAPDPGIGNMLKGFIATVRRTGFEYPVRVLLLERKANGEWFKTIAPMDSTGADIRSFCYHEDEKTFDYQLRPLSSDALLAIVRGRLPGRGTELSDKLLLDTLGRIDPPSPRPLFAAATAMKIADMMESAAEAITVISELELSTLQLEDVLAWIIERERTHFWVDGEALEKDTRTDNERLGIHENLLLIATMALDIPRAKYDDECPETSRKYLPDRLDEDRFGRMTSGNPVVALKRLEPDILGEFFVLDRLKRLPPRDRQSLIDAGLALGGSNSAVFLVRCAIDFPKEWRDLNFLTPSIRGPAMVAFAEAAFVCTCYLENHRFDDVAHVITVVQELAKNYDDPLLHEPLGRALINNAAILNELERCGEAIKVYDEVDNRYGTADQAALRALGATALVNKGEILDDLKRSDEAIELYDKVVSQYGTEEELVLRAPVARALCNKGHSLKELGRGNEAIAASNDVVSRYGTASEPELRQHVARALVTKGASLTALGRSDKAIATSNDEVILSMTLSDGRVIPYYTDEDLEQRIRDAPALLAKGVSLDELGRHDEAVAIYDKVVSYAEGISQFRSASQQLRQYAAKARLKRRACLNRQAITVYDEVIRRYGTASERALRYHVAGALFCKADSLWALGGSNEAIAVYALVVKRYGTATELARLVATAIRNIGVLLGKQGRGDKAIAAFDQLVKRYRGTSDLALREKVAEALYMKAVGLGKLRLCNKAIAVCDELVHQYGTARELPLREKVAEALLYKASLLESQAKDLRYTKPFSEWVARIEDARATYRDVSNRCGTDRKLFKFYQEAMEGIGWIEDQKCPCGSGRRYADCHGSPVKYSTLPIPATLPEPKRSN
jgi:tetratricopeptide (TPR) repeat protein